MTFLGFFPKTHTETPHFSFTINKEPFSSFFTSELFIFVLSSFFFLKRIEVLVVLFNEKQWDQFVEMRVMTRATRSAETKRAQYSTGSMQSPKTGLSVEACHVVGMDFFPIYNEIIERISDLSSDTYRKVSRIQITKDLTQVLMSKEQLAAALEDVLASCLKFSQFLDLVFQTARQEHADSANFIEQLKEIQNIFLGSNHPNAQQFFSFFCFSVLSQLPYSTPPLSFWSAM